MTKSAPMNRDVSISAGENSDSALTSKQSNPSLLHLPVGPLNAPKHRVDLVVKMPQHLSCRYVLGLAPVVAVDRLERVDHQPGRWLDGFRAHVDSVVARREAHLFVGVADLQSSVSPIPCYPFLR